MNTKLLLMGIMMAFSGATFAAEAEAGGDVDNGSDKVPADVRAALTKYYITQTKNTGPWQKARAKKLQEIADECGGRGHNEPELDIVEVEGEESHEMRTDGGSTHDKATLSVLQSGKYLVFEKISCGVHRGGMNSTINALLVSEDYSSFAEVDPETDETKKLINESRVFKIIGTKLEDLYKKPYEVGSDSSGGVVNEAKVATRPAAAKVAPKKEAPKQFGTGINPVHH
ncbi:MAG: hypothetical protein ABIR96_00695 [Bdellovibrionota bacterium]